MMRATYYYVLITVSCLPLSLHLVGLLLLWKARLMYCNKSQLLFLVNLSVAEFLFVLLGILMYVSSVTGHSQISYHCTVLQYTGATLAYFLIMIFMTVDRFLEIYLNLKYPLYWNAKSTRNLMAVMWFTCTAFSLAGLLSPGFTKVRLYEVCYKYLFPSIELTFLLIATLVYGYVLVKLRWNPLVCTNCMVVKQRHQRRRMSGFFVPALVVITFILFAVLPDLVQFHAHVVGRKLSDEAEFFVYLMYLLAMLADALIYLLLSPPLRTIIRKKITSSPLKMRRRRLRHASTPSVCVVTSSTTVVGDRFLSSVNDE